MPGRPPSLSRRALLAATPLGALAVAGCTTGEGVDLDAGGGGSGYVPAFSAAIGGEPDQLDPHQTSAYFSFQVLENVFDTLVEPDDELEFTGALAEDWTLSEDQLTWTFTLREGLTFHDGSPCTSEDVLYSYRRIIDGELSNAWRFAAVADIEAPDERTVVITVSQPAPDLLSSLGNFKGMAIVQRDNVESGSIADRPIGTGPFSRTPTAPAIGRSCWRTPTSGAGSPRSTASPSASSPRAPPRRPRCRTTRSSGPTPSPRSRRGCWKATPAWRWPRCPPPTTGTWR